MENKKKQNYDNQYIKNNKDRINFVMDKGTKDRIKLGADKLGQTSSEFIREAIEEKLFKLGIEKKIFIPSDQEGQEAKNNEWRGKQ